MYYSLCAPTHWDLVFSYVTFLPLQIDQLPALSLSLSLRVVLNNAVSSLLALDRLHNMLQMARWTSADLCFRGE